MSVNWNIVIVIKRRLYLYPLPLNNNNKNNKKQSSSQNEERYFNNFYWNILRIFNHCKLSLIISNYLYKSINTFIHSFMNKLFFL